MASLLELDNPAHENATRTASNARAPLFGGLPLEIRISIYEYVLTEDYPIRPYQVAERSNKFVPGGNSITEFGSRVRSQNMGKVFVSDFQRTCRQIYFELKAFPVFYRVNKFDFAATEPLIKFLSAITPQRRAFIRNVVLRTSYSEMMPCTWNNCYEETRKMVYRSAAVLLCQCEDLRDLEIQLPLWSKLNKFSPAHPQKIYTMNVLKRSIECFTSQPPTYAIWNLPYIKPVLTGPCLCLGEKCNHPETLIDLTDSQAPDLAHPVHWLSDQDFQHLIQEAKMGVGSLRKRLAAAETEGRGYRASITPNQLNEAINSSNIDFPGEDRILRDRFNSTTGAISTRTRQKCNKDTVNDLGILQRSTSKYDAEGILTWNTITFHAIRWNGSIIECDVENDGYDGAEKARSWETLDAVLTPYGRWGLQVHYQKLIHAGWVDPVRYLQEIQELPSPKDITNVINPLLHEWRTDKPRSFKIWVNSWRQAQNQYENLLETLNHAAEAAKAPRKPNMKRKAGLTTPGCKSHERAAKRGK